MVQHARRLVGGKLASLLLEHDGRLETVATDGAEAPDPARADAALHEAIVGRVVRDGNPLVVENLGELRMTFPASGRDRAASPPLRRDLSPTGRGDFAEVISRAAAAEGLTSLLSAPVRTKRRVVGVLNVYRGERRAFGRQEIEVMSLLALQAAAAIENASLFHQVRETREHLRRSEKLAALGRLSAGLAHELRNPLNTLNVLVYALTLPSRPGGVSPADLEVVGSEIRRMRLLLDQFLDFARPRSPSFARHRAEEVLEETLLLVGPEAAKRGIRIERRFEAATPPVWADGDQLKQVLLNLALNALQAMSMGGMLTAGVRAVTGSVVVEIRDDGPGIPPEVRERLFEPFFTTREGGTGLGLAVALRIVEAHSGELRIDSGPGNGTRASVWLPA